MTGLQIYTGTYQRFEAHMGVPVRSTVGLPRFGLKYVLAGHWVSVTPQRAWLTDKVNEADFRRMYRHKLHKIGVDRVMQEAEDIATFAGDNRVVALCFDDLRKPGMWCHRQMLGEWLEEQGVPVIELFPGPEKYVPPKGPDKPLTVQEELF